MATTPQRLNDRHEAAARLFAAGMRRGEVARQLGYHPSTLSHVRRSPMFVERIRVLQREISAEMIAALVARLGPQRGHRNRSATASLARQ
jgi:hypothetical protein